MSPDSGAPAPTVASLSRPIPIRPRSPRPRPLPPVEPGCPVNGVRVTSTAGNPVVLGRLPTRAEHGTEPDFIVGGKCYPDLVASPLAWAQTRPSFVQRSKSGRPRRAAHRPRTAHCSAGPLAVPHPVAETREQRALPVSRWRPCGSHQPAEKRRAGSLGGLAASRRPGPLLALRAMNAELGEPRAAPRLRGAGIGPGRRSHRRRVPFAPASRHRRASSPTRSVMFQPPQRCALGCCVMCESVTCVH